MTGKGTFGRRRQRGIIAVMAIIFLIAVIIFALTQTRYITGTNVTDSAQQVDSTAALFMAESGLERAKSILTAAGSAVSGSTCTGISTSYACSGTGAGSVSFSNGRSYCYTSTPTPSPDSSCSGGSCDSCTVTVTGKANTASRNLSLVVKLSQILGISGNGGYVSDPPTCSSTLSGNNPIQVTLQNNYNGQYAGTAIFQLGFIQHSSGSPSLPQSCGNNLSELFLVSSSQGNAQGSLFGYADYANIALSQSTVPSAVHGFSGNEDYSLVGVIFPNSSSSQTTPIGKYWNSSSSSSSTVLANNSPSSPYQYYGNTNSGVAGGSTTCTTPSQSNPNTQQACTSWCLNADTMVYNFSAHSTGTSNSLSSVTFDYGDTTHQNVALSKLVHFPGSSATGTATDVYSDVWYLYNKAYASETLQGSSYTLGAGATSYPSAVKGTVGATFNASFSKTSRTVMTVSSISSGTLSIGDTVSPGDSKLDSTVTITAVPSPGPTGNYTFSGNVYVGSANSYSPSGVTTQSTRLIVQGSTGSNLTGSNAGTITNNTAATSTFFTVNGTGTAVASNLYIQSGPTSAGSYSYYTISSAAMASPYTPVAGRTNGTTQITQGTSGTTITLPTGSTAVDSSYVGTYVAVYNGNGKFAAQTKIASVASSTQFTVDKTLSSAISGAIVCGGICAFFNNPSSTASNTTQFQVTASGAGTQDWVSGFTCLSGVLSDKIYVIPASTSATSTTWHEVVQ